MQTITNKNRRENFLHYIWKFSLYDTCGLVSTDGQVVEVLSPGLHNDDSGPDFTDARIKIGGTLWAGNVEIHQRASDWIRHNHHKDKAYDTVILHVVEHDDVPVSRTCGSPVPALKMVFEPKLLDNYEQLLRGKRWLYCEESLAGVSPLVVDMWLERLVVERLEYKTASVHNTLCATKNDWHTAFYHLLARSFGSSINADAFEQLALSVPLGVLAKHSDSIPHLEALLFGQSGLLDAAQPDEYVCSLKQEYVFLKDKYGLIPCNAATWKFMRLRPMNFPTLRISQFAHLVSVSTALLSKVISAGNTEDIRLLFDVRASDYWNTHYSFGKPSLLRPKHLGHQAIDVILINTIIPFLFHYGEMNGLPQLKDKALEYLNSLPFEINQVTGRWVRRIDGLCSAARSQALIHLEKHYCSHGKCLHCPIGNAIVRRL